MKGCNQMSELEIIETTPNANVLEEIRALASGTPKMYSSIKGEDFEAKKATFSAVSSAKKIRENLGKKINLENIIVQALDMADEQTGEISSQPRVILIDADGTAFYGISGGLFRSVDDIIGMLGEPHTWPAPLPVAVKEIQGKGANRFYTIELL